MSTEFERLQGELHAIMDRKHDARELKLLNVGMDHSGEYHWRFRDPSGQIVTLKMEIEKP